MEKYRINKFIIVKNSCLLKNFLQPSKHYLPLAGEGCELHLVCRNGNSMEDVITCASHL